MSPSPCVPCCSTPVITDVIGSPGLPGEQGATGADGPAGPAAELIYRSAFGGGTPFEMPVNDTPVLLSLGTTQPSIVLPEGTWMIGGRARFDGDGATLTDQVLQTYFKCINNTPAILDSTDRSIQFIPQTTVDGTLAMQFYCPVPYVATEGDNIQFFGAIDKALGAGKIYCIEADIVALKIAD